jgi:hypothetical protein
LRTRGIRVSVIEPAYTLTQFEANFLAPDSSLDEYREVRALLDKVLEEVMATADEPAVVADVVLQAAMAARPKLRYTAGGLANRPRLLRRFAPARLGDGGIRKDPRLDAPTASLAPAALHPERQSRRHSSSIVTRATHCASGKCRNRRFAIRMSWSPSTPPA